MQDFWREHQFIPVDARYSGVPVAIAAEMLGGKPKRKRPAKRWTWEDCQALAKELGVRLGHEGILFLEEESGLWLFSVASEGKTYSFRNNPTSCYEALLSLHRDRLARMSDEDLIKAAAAANEAIF